MFVEAPDGSKVEWKSPEWMARTDFAPSIPDPLSVCLPFLSGEPQWLILGGLGDLPDGQEARQRWPQVRMVGIDPDLRSIRWQIEHDWPVDAPLLALAFSDSISQDPMYLDDLNCPSLHPHNLAVAPAQLVVPVSTVTLDSLDLIIGPFERAILWLDLEGYDYKALCGASKLLTSGRVLLVGIEVRYHLEEDTNPAMRQLLRDAGYEHCLTWFRQWWGHNELWSRKV